MDETEGEKDKGATRRLRFDLQETAAKILDNKRLKACLNTVVGLGGGVEVIQGQHAARFHGLQTCGSVWACPVCSAKICDQRREEINKAMKWVRAQGGSPYLMTLTTRHGAGDDCALLLRALKEALRTLKASYAWKSLQPHLLGNIAATEVTHGRNGWHPHMHMLVFLSSSADGIMGGRADVEALLRAIGPAWQAALEKHGLSGNDHSFDLQAGTAAGDYVSKFGAALELVGSSTKIGRKTGSLTPWQLLAVAAGMSENPVVDTLEERDENGWTFEQRRAAALFRDYANAFAGRSQLQWSRGLKDKVGVDEKTDEEMATLKEAQSMEVIVAHLLTTEWKMLRKVGVKRTAILEAAEAGPDELLAVLAPVLGDKEAMAVLRRAAMAQAAREPILAGIREEAAFYRGEAEARKTGQTLLPGLELVAPRTAPGPDHFAVQMALLGRRPHAMTLEEEEAQEAAALSRARDGRRARVEAEKMICAAVDDGMARPKAPMSRPAKRRPWARPDDPAPGEVQRMIPGAVAAWNERKSAARLARWNERNGQ